MGEARQLYAENDHVDDVPVTTKDVLEWLKMYPESP